MDKTENYSSVSKRTFNNKPATEFRGHTAKVIGCLPSITGHDVTNAYMENTIDARTIIFAWEKLKNRREKVEEILRSIADESYIIGSEIYDTDLEIGLKVLKWICFFLIFAAIILPN